MINIAVKTNYSKNGRSYFRVSAVLGTDSSGKRIIKEFYGKSKSESELLGHSSIDITADIYTHVMPKEKTNAVEKLNSFFAENL